MLARTAFAAEIVSLWICMSVPFFFRSAEGGAVVCGGITVGGAGVDCDDVEVDDGSDVIRSISVVPDESAMIGVLIEMMKQRHQNYEMHIDEEEKTL